MSYTKDERLQLANDFIRVLNSAFECDKDALHKLTEFRVRCNAALAQHPTIQVRTQEESSNSGVAKLVPVHRIGLLGILNGLIGIDDFGNAYLAGSYDNQGKLVRFMLNANLGKSK